jgi:hypothetical protein
MSEAQSGSSRGPTPESRLREAAKQCRIVREDVDDPHLKAALDENIASLENLAAQLEEGDD